MKLKAMNLNFLINILRLNMILASSFFIVCIAVILLIPFSAFFSSIFSFLIILFTSGLNVLLIGISYFVGSYNLLKIVQSIKTRRSFDSINGKRLRISGLILFLTAIHIIFMNILISTASIAYLDFINSGFAFDTPINSIIFFVVQFYKLNPAILIIFSLTLLALAEVFIQGNQIKEEQDLTI